MKKIILLLVIAGSPLLACAQDFITSNPMEGIHPYPDSIRIEFPDQHGLLVLNVNNFKLSKGDVARHMELIRETLANVEKGIASTTVPKAIDVTLDKEGERTISIRDVNTPITQITATDKEILQLLPPGWEMKIQIPARANILVYAQTFAELKEIASYDPEKLVALMVDKAEKTSVGRKRYVARAIVQKGQITSSDIKFQMPQDFLLLNISAGMGYLNANFCPELNFTMSLQRGNRLNYRNTRINLTYNNLFFSKVTADGTFRNRTNSFLSLSYSHRFGHPTGTHDDSGTTWGSIGAGYLITRNGDYFTGKTMKFFFSTTTGKFSITPEFYLTNDFKTFHPGLKFVYTF